MTKPVLLVTRAYSPAVEKRAARDYDARLNPNDVIMDADRLIERATGADAILMTVSEPMDAAMIARLPASVKILANYGVGHEHIDLAAARTRGLLVTNTPDAVTAATADVTMLALLGVARRGFEAQRMLREDRWRGFSAGAMLGRDVTGKRLGIVGMGRIGRAVAQRARGFEMEIHYHNRRRLDAGREGDAVYHADPATLLPVCDFLSLHVPATPETRHWLDADRIAALPNGAFVINTSRGTAIDEDALVAALTAGKLAGAGLDVFQTEPRVRADLRALDNCYLLPHIGSATIETRDAMGFECLDNLDAFFAGRSPPARIA